MSFLPLRLHRIGVAEPVLPETPLPCIVLGARVFPDGSASDALRDRVVLGVELLHQGRATRLIFTGGTPDGRPTEAAAMRAIALSAGVPDERITLESASTTTLENAARCAELFTEREVLLVTCDFHLARASAIFREAGFTVWPVPSRRLLSRADRARLMTKETAAMLARPSLLKHL